MYKWLRLIASSATSMFTNKEVRQFRDMKMEIEDLPSGNVGNIGILIFPAC